VQWQRRLLLLLLLLLVVSLLLLLPGWRVTLRPMPAPAAGAALAACCR
jgi:hypothetical protein